MKFHFRLNFAMGSHPAVGVWVMRFLLPAPIPVSFLGPGPNLFHVQVPPFRHIRFHFPVWALGRGPGQGPHWVSFPGLAPAQAPPRQGTVFHCCAAHPRLHPIQGPPQRRN